MYSKLPNLVLAFHGCDRSVADRVIGKGEPLRPSTNEYDWLGSGTYFWEQNYERGLEWAKEQFRRGSVAQPAVVGAVIDLGHCLNLTDSKYIGLLENEYQYMRAEFEILELELPKNEGKTPDRLLRKLDCAVIEHLHARLDREREEGLTTLAPFDSVRGLFSEGDPIYPAAGFRKKTHVQICVRNPNCIKGFFDPRKPSKNWPLP